MSGSAPPGSDFLAIERYSMIALYTPQTAIPARAVYTTLPNLSMMYVICIAIAHEMKEVAAPRKHPVRTVVLVSTLNHCGELATPHARARGGSAGETTACQPRLGA